MTNDGYRLALPVAQLIDQFNKLPGVGPKSAQRLAFHLIRSKKEDAEALAEAIIAVKEKLVFCSLCFNITEGDPCGICIDTSRDRTRICVVEEALDVQALERTNSYSGTYHVLHGVISPINGIGPQDLTIAALLERLAKSKEVEEIILATNPNLEGEATSMYINSLVGDLGIRMTRPARGLPVGGDLEYADEVTLGRAIEGRETFI